MLALRVCLFVIRQSNPAIQQWMMEHNYTDYSKLEEYYEQKCVTCMCRGLLGVNRSVCVHVNVCLCVCVHACVVIGCRLLDLVASLGKKYIVWQEIFDNKVKVSLL